MTISGYIIGISNPHFSGIATVQVAEKPDAWTTRDPGKRTDLHVDAGSGVRAIVNAFGGRWEDLKAKAPTTLVTFEVEGTLITSFEFGE